MMEKLSYAGFFLLLASPVILGAIFSRGIIRVVACMILIPVCLWVAAILFL